ncbi:MAG: Ig-like domain-containing protein [Pseudomonadales bacterium]|nr:Ig-like domain-containing protein [Pseudomonadales bacterium]
MTACLQYFLLFMTLFLTACSGSGGSGTETDTGTGTDTGTDTGTGTGTDIISKITNFQLFKSDSNTLVWISAGAASCSISNDQNDTNIDIQPEQLNAGSMLHGLPVNTIFTVHCLDENGVSSDLTANGQTSTPFPQTVGYYGSMSSLNNSWAAIVNLTKPISYTDSIDFNTQVDDYCSALGYVGAVKTETGSFSLNDTYYFQNGDGIIAGSGPSDKVTLIPDNKTFTHIYTNRRNTDSSNGNPGRAVIGDHASTINQSISSPTSGVDQMVLCQTNLLIGNTIFIAQNISFAETGPIRKVLGLDAEFSNEVASGLGKGAITYSSSDDSVATVDVSTGKVTIIGLGTTTITVDKAADLFVKAQDSFVLNVENPQPLQLTSFTKTSVNTLSWQTAFALSCDISNDQNSEVVSLATSNLSAGSLLHALPENTVFSLTCQDEAASSTSLSATAVGVNPFPQTVGYYGDNNNPESSWSAIVNLTTPIDYVDRVDFNTQVDSYCSSLGYVGAAKTKSGSFSVNDTYYFQNSDGIIAGNGPSRKITLIPDDVSFTNVYTNRRNEDSSNGNVGRATIGNHNSSIDLSISSPTSGADPMVLCQTDMPVGNSAFLSQTINFAEAGPIRQILDIHISYRNIATGRGGLGSTTYTSSNVNVAMVNSVSGEVTLLGLGSVTITADKAGDMFMPAQASYVINVEAPKPVQMTSFSKTGEYTLQWVTDSALFCQISNDQHIDVIDVDAASLSAGKLLHGLAVNTVFTLTCLGEDGVAATLSATAVDNNMPPQTVGYYGSLNGVGNSWSAIVNLANPISYTDRIDFNTQVDAYCSSLGYIGAVKTQTGSFSINDTYYIQNNDGIIAGNGPSQKITFIPADKAFTNIYTNRRNSDSSHGNPGRAVIGDHNSTINQSISSPTSGVDQMVLCQIDIQVSHTAFLPQSISFEEAGPIRKVLGMQTEFTHVTSAGPGSGAITYASSDVNVATVNASTGTVNIVGLGTTTITATKAGDMFLPAQDSYVLNIDSPQTIQLQSFIKNSDSTLSWATDFAVSCDITNDQNAEVITVATSNFTTGALLHALPVSTTFTLACVGETGTSSSLSVTNVVSNDYPQTVGYYGSRNSPDNSWAAIVNLTSPISYLDRNDFNTQVDGYCSGLGYLGVVKTQAGTFSINDTYYLHVKEGIIDSYGPSQKVTFIPADVTLTNVYTNRRHSDSSAGDVAIAKIGNHSSSITNYSTPSPTTGVDQMVLCQTDMRVSDTAFLAQSISFDVAGPIRQVLGVHADYSNVASGGQGNGAITYSSSDVNVATVDAASGTVTVVGLGSTIITATKAADHFEIAQDSYNLNIESPEPIQLLNFVKTGDATLSWSSEFAVSCEISNDQNAEVITVAGESLSAGSALHTYPAGATLTLSCIGEQGGTSNISVSTVTTQAFPQTMGYYGSTSSLDNSWAAIVNLTSPITFTDQSDFNAQVDTYCSSLGYIGAVKTGTGDFSLDDSNYLQNNSGIISGNGPYQKATLIADDVSFSNVFSNQYNDINSRVYRVKIGNNDSSTIETIYSTTTGEDQMVLCQTDISFKNTGLLPQAINFDLPGPIRKVQSIDPDFSNIASGGMTSASITYSSSNELVASVNMDTGLISMMGMGAAVITATKAADDFYQLTQVTYTLNIDTAQSMVMHSFEKTSGSSFSWSTSFAIACEIHNDQNAELILLDRDKSVSGTLLHGLPAATLFTLRCEGELGGLDTRTASVVGTNPFPETVGYYGSLTDQNNSWAAIVNLSPPIDYTDRLDFNAKVDSYCLGLGYVGVVQTKSGHFSVNDSYYLQTSDGIIAGSGPFNKVTLILGNLSYSNVYSNRRNTDSSNGNVGRVTIGNHISSITQSISSPTSGVDPMVLCQTTRAITDAVFIPQTITFNNVGPVDVSLAVDSPYTNSLNTLPSSGAISYSSSNPSIATVDASTGEVTLLTTGTTTITVNKVADTQFMQAEASYLLNVAE